MVLGSLLSQKIFRVIIMNVGYYSKTTYVFVCLFIQLMY